MAINIGTKTIDVAVEERTFQVVLKSPKGEDGTIVVYREARTTLADGTLVAKVDRPAIHRQASAILSQTVVLPDGSTISAASLVAALPLFFDRWATEDAATLTQGV